MRETLFNWLQQTIPGARCLDLYAGSGALGFEALSRGAAHVTFVDQDVRVIQQLRSNIELLEATNAETVWTDALGYLQGGASGVSSGPFDIVFLDPPYREHALTAACEQLERSGLLAATALIYLEADAAETPPTTGQLALSAQPKRRSGSVIIYAGEHRHDPRRHLSGTFDPITNGLAIWSIAPRSLRSRHRRGGCQPRQGADLHARRTHRHGRQALGGIAGVEVCGFDRLLVDFARERGAGVILRGLRAVSISNMSSSSPA